MSARPKIVVSTSFPVHPPRGGGQRRVAGLYGALAAHGVEVDIVSLGDRSDRARVLCLTPGLRELRVPKTPAHEGAEWQLQLRAGVPATDLALALHHDLTPAYAEAVAECARDADAVVACHPFGRPALAAATDRPLIYEAQDVEADLKASMYQGSSHGDDLAAAVRQLEEECCAQAHHVTVCLDSDRDRLIELYGNAAHRAVTVPNGAAPEAVTFASLEDRRRRRESLGLGSDLLAVFVASWHEPNLVAVRDLLRLAPQLEDARVLILGSAGLAFAGQAIPANVDLCGVVDDAFLAGVLSLAGAALNPMRLGSGSNLKMLEYALAGVPIVSTLFGARGLGLEAGRHYIECEPDSLPAALRDLGTQATAELSARVAAAREHVLARFSWPAIARDWLADDAMRELLDAAGVDA